jgi:plasmid stabilization system protein ParE
MKKYKFIYSPHALTDLEDAVYYYNEQQKVSANGSPARSN